MAVLFMEWLVLALLLYASGSDGDLHAGFEMDMAALRRLVLTSGSEGNSCMAAFGYSRSYMSGALAVASYAFKLPDMGQNQLAECVSFEMTDRATTFYYCDLINAKVMRSYAHRGVYWPHELEPDVQDDFFAWLQIEKWSVVMQTASAAAWALLYRASSSDGVAPDHYADLFSPGQRLGVSSRYIRHLARLRALPACDRGCLVDTAATFASLALLAAERGDIKDSMDFLDSAQSMFQAAHFTSFDELFVAVRWKSTLMALWGLLHCFAVTPLVQTLRDQFELTANVTHFQTVELPDPTPNCPTPQAPLPPDMALEMYRMVHIVGQLLSWHRLDWFVSHGTLLGAVRHGGIIPHECDIDLTIRLRDVHKLRDLKFLEALRFNGYELALRPIQWLYAILRPGAEITAANWLPQMYMSLRPYLNIYVMSGGRLTTGPDEGAVWKYASNAQFHSSFALREEDLFPPKTVPFGSSFVNVPADPRKYLSNMYDDDWELTVRSRHALQNTEFWDKFTMDKDAFQMALPTGPLPLVHFPRDIDDDCRNNPLHQTINLQPRLPDEWMIVTSKEKLQNVAME